MFDVFQCNEVSCNEYNFSTPTTFLYQNVTAVCTWADHLIPGLIFLCVNE